MRRPHPAHIGLIVIFAIAILLGYFTARVNAQDRPEWVLLRGELSGQEPDRVSVEALTAAMLGAMLAHPEQAMQLYQTALVIACNHRERPKRATVMVLYAASQLYPEFTEIFVAIARELCPKSGAHEKVVIPRVEEDWDTPFNFAGISPPREIFTPVTPVQDK